MAKWPTSRAPQALIAFGVAAVLAVCVFIWTNNASFDRYAQKYPSDGQDGLGALMDAVEAGAATLVGVFFSVFVLQRNLAATEAPDSNSPTE